MAYGSPGSWNLFNPPKKDDGKSIDWAKWYILYVVIAVALLLLKFMYNYFKLGLKGIKVLNPIAMGGNYGSVSTDHASDQALSDYLSWLKTMEGSS